MLPQQACRNALIGLTTDQGSAGSHSGLVLDCYLRETGNPESRRALISSASRAQEKAKALYTIAYKRWDRETSSGYVRARVVTEGRLILGLPERPSPATPMRTGAKSAGVTWPIPRCR